LAVPVEQKSPLAFVDEYGQATLEVDKPDVGTHFVLTSVLVEEAAAPAARAAVDAIREKYFPAGDLRAARLAKSPQRFRQVLDDVNRIPFKFYAVVVDKREIQGEAGLAFQDSFYKFLSGLLYRKLFAAFPNLHVTADELGREDFMAGFAKYLVANHRDTLFDRPRVAFASGKEEPLIQLADLVCGAIARTYDAANTTQRSADLLARIRTDHALVIDEWPVRYRAASGTGSLIPGDTADDDIARYAIASAEKFIETHDGSTDEERRAQLVALKKLLYEVRFGDARTYVPTQVLRETLEAIGESRGEQWLRSNVIAQLRDAGVLVASSPQGYKIPVTISDVSDFVAVTDTVVHPMLNRVARARNAVLLITKGRVDVLSGEKLTLLRAAVDSIGKVGEGEPLDE
jgi:hypothetical protein